MKLFSDQPPRVEDTNFLETIPTNIDTFQNQQPTELNQDFFPQQQPQPQTSNLSSVFSSFSNILKLKTTQETPQNEIAAPPAGIESILSQPSTNVAPVPLFPSSGIANTPPTAPPQASSNTYRRPGLKRPVYAQIPGLSNNPQPNFSQPPQPQTYPQPPQPQTFAQPLQPQTFTQPPQPQTFPQPPQPQTFAQPPQPQTFAQPPQPQSFSQPQQPLSFSQSPQLQTFPQPQTFSQPQHFSQPPSASTFFQPPPGISPASSVSSNQDSSVASHFKPISPQPPTFLNPVSTPQIYTPNFFTPVSSHLQSPVMAAIPANELLQTPDVGSGLPTDVDGQALPATNVISSPKKFLYHYKVFLGS